MLWTFDMEGFMSYMVAEFPEPMSNHFTYDLVQNVVEDAQMQYLETNHFAAMLSSRIPEVTKEDVLMFCNKERMDEREM